MSIGIEKPPAKDRRSFISSVCPSLVDELGHDEVVDGQAFRGVGREREGHALVLRQPVVRMMVLGFGDLGDGDDERDRVPMVAADERTRDGLAALIGQPLGSVRRIGGRLFVRQRFDLSPTGDAGERKERLGHVFLLGTLLDAGTGRIAAGDRVVNMKDRPVRDERPVFFCDPRYQLPGAGDGAGSGAGSGEGSGAGGVMISRSTPGAGAGAGAGVLFCSGGRAYMTNNTASTARMMMAMMATAFEPSPLS